MGRELDRRNFNADRVTAARESELQIEAERVSNALPANHRVRIEGFSAATGNPTRVISEAAPAEVGNYLERAKNHLQAIRSVMGLAANQPAEYSADDNYQVTSDGSVAVHLQQTYKGLDIFECTKVVRFAPDGAIVDSVGGVARIDRDMIASPSVSIKEAVRKAAVHVCAPGDDEHQFDHFGEPLQHSIIDLDGVDFKVREVVSDGPDQATYFEPGPFDDKIKASLLWFLLGDELRLAWEVLLNMPNSEGQYRVLIDANGGSVLYCSQLMRWIAGCGNVYLADGSVTRSTLDFPRPLVDYGLPIPTDLPPTIPEDWVGTTRSEGNNVFAHLDANGPSLEGNNQSGLVSFNPVDPVGDDQKVLNIFYYNGYIHDYFYLLGFRERDGNFQENNFARGGAPSDRVDARAHSGAVFGTANMATPIDGLNPVMNMGLVTSTNRHTAFDSSVFFHEFMHGVTNRLVGGPTNSRALEQPQSGGMGEGWGDYIACTINQNDTVGAWVVNQANGIRGFRYDDNFPDHFGNLGTGRYSQVPQGVRLVGAG
jgi:extracellular elastinolytic metalloproteinase